MKFLFVSFTLVLSILCNLVVLAEADNGLSFAHNDWQVACDNTGTCRIVGYQGDDSDNAVSVLLTRKAGKGTVVEGQLKLSAYGSNPDDIGMPSSITMSINNNDLGDIGRTNDLFILSNKQSMALVESLAGVSTILFKSDKQQWLLSDQGSTAVLIKADEFQKRLGTKGALINKGNLDESNVLKAKPLPVINKPNLPFDGQTEILGEQKKQVLNVLKEEGGCVALDEGDEIDNIYMHSLDEKYSLVTSLCWWAAYNDGNGFWLMDKSLSRVYSMITDSGESYSDGVIYESHKGRGLGDCWNGKSWAWDGLAFVAAEEYSTGLCKGIPGGAWELPTIVSEIE